MKIKTITAVSIFLLLFTLAWLWDQQHIREFYDPEKEKMADPGDVVEVLPMTYQLDPLPKKYKVFKSREYVRIEEL